ncbi:hypothetical protein [Haloferula sp.]|uniref:hypothetical protein n=1 Tax=Haloferula sp. TaxID=2497595 RepID=UPI00329C0C0D
MPLLPLVIACMTLPCHSETDAVAEAGVGKSYVLMSEKPEKAPGLKTTVSDVMSMEGGKFSIDSAQGVLEGTMAIKTTKVISASNETAAKVNVKITKSEAEQKMIMNGQELPQPPQVLPLVDVPLVATLTNGIWRAAREDGEKVSAVEQAELLNAERLVSGVEDKNVYGTGARKPGDTWTVDAKKMSMVDAGDDVEGTVEMSFEKVDAHKGEECAFLSGEINMTGSTPSAEGDNGVKMELKGTFEIVRSLKDQVDLFREMKGTMEMEMNTPAGIMKMSGPTVMKRTSVVGKE